MRKIILPVAVLALALSTAGAMAQTGGASGTSGGAAAKSGSDATAPMAKEDVTADVALYQGPPVQAGTTRLGLPATIR
jgi:hypothetical protein